MTTDTKASLTTAWPDIAAGLPERELPMKFTLRTALRGNFPILKKVLVTLTPGWCPLTTWVSVPKMTNEFTLGLDIMHAHNASVELRCHVLQLGSNNEVPFRYHVVQLCSTPCMKGNSKVGVVQ